jgi:hypothetical protein
VEARPWQHEPGTVVSEGLSVVDVEAHEVDADADSDWNDGALAAGLVAEQGERALRLNGMYEIAEVVTPTATEIVGTGWRTGFKFDVDAPAFAPLRHPPGATDIRLADFAIDGSGLAMAAAHPTWDPDSLANWGTTNGGPAQGLLADGFTDPCKRIYWDRLRIFNQFRLGGVMQSTQDFRVAYPWLHDLGRDGLTFYYDSWQGTIICPRIERFADDGLGLNSENAASTGHSLDEITVICPIIRGPSSRVPGKGRGICARGGRGLRILYPDIANTAQSGIVLGDYNTTPLEDVEVIRPRVRNPGTNAALDRYGIWVNANEPADHPNGWAHVSGVLIDRPFVDGAPAGPVAIRDSRTGGPQAGDIDDVTITRPTYRNSGNGNELAVETGGVSNLVRGTDEGPWMHTIPLTTEAAVKVGNWQYNADPNSAVGGNVYNASNAQNDEIGWDLLLSAGTWRVTILAIPSANRAIASVLLDGVVAGAIDAYNAALSYNAPLSVDIVVPRSGKHRISFKAATRNVAAIGWYISWEQIQLRRTA